MTKSTCGIVIFMIYKNINIIMFKVLGSNLHSFFRKYIYSDYLCLRQYKLYKKDGSFNNTTSDDSSEIGIPVVSMSVMACCIFSREQQSIIILPFLRKFYHTNYQRGLRLLKQSITPRRLVLSKSNKESIHSTIIQVQHKISFNCDHIEESLHTYFYLHLLFLKFYDDPGNNF